MNTTTNAFLKGMRTDLHPLATDNQTYTDALNATLITYNGNELMMQNDMGNTKIQDSKTGNIMGLREGFVPVGLKEHGGIIYIASVNKDGEGEIGTIPSPIIKYNQSGDPFTFNGKEFIINGISGRSDLFLISDRQLKVGDKFIAFLPIENEDIVSFLYSTSTVSNLYIKVPLIQKRDENGNIKGIYRIGLYSQAEDQVYDLNYLVQDSNFTFHVKTNGVKEEINADRWYINRDPNTTEFDVDSSLVYEQSDDRTAGSPFIVYPKISSGYPAIRYEINRLDSFSFLPNHTSSEDNSRRYPFTVLKDDSYFTYIPGFEYITTNGVHPTTVKVSLVREDTNTKLLDSIEFNNRYIKNGSEDTFYMMYTGTYPSDDKLVNSFYENSQATLFAKEVNIGKDSNVWFTLTADYYYEDVKLGSYECRFNPYLYDTLKNFKQKGYIPHDNYNGEGNIWFQQYYDINKRSAANLEKTFSGTYISNGGDRDYPSPSGAGISLFKYMYPTSYGKAFLHYGNTEVKGVSESYYNEFDVLIGNNQHTFQRPGIILKDLVTSDFDNIKDITELWKNDHDLNSDINYLYTKSVSDPDFQNYNDSKIVLKYYLNNLGFRLHIEKYISSTYDNWTNNSNINYEIVPSTNLKKTIPIIVSKSDDSIKTLAPAEGNLLEGIIELTYNQFISLMTVYKFDERDYYQPLFKLTGITDYYLYIDNDKVYLDGDPWMSKHSHCNDSSVELDLYIDNKLGISEVSDYQVVPQINVIYEEDDLLYPGYLNGNFVEEIDVDNSYNYFLKNGISEGEYLLNTKFHPFEETSIYGSGFGYYKLDISTVNIMLNPGIYVVNFNTNLNQNYNIRLYFNENKLNSGYNTSISYDGVNYYIELYSGQTIGSFKITELCILTRIRVGELGHFDIIIGTSFGLYKAKDSYNLSNKPKLQTVYTYSEENKKCLDKTYTYSGGSAFCGYQKNESTYSANTGDEYFNNIQVRRCLA